jgi:putative endonuclease
VAECPLIFRKAELSGVESGIMYYTYILQSTKNKRLYIGSSDNLIERYVDHNAGRVFSTKPYRPWGLIYYEAHRNKTLARKAELFYKTGQGRRQLKKKLGL